jgi:exodeoxyribonuclease V gamma subunit
LNLFYSNRLEELSGRLAEVLAEPLQNPLAPELIVVQSQGMARWLKLELARQHGICANVQFPFPKAFAHEIFKRVLPGLPNDNPWDREVILWQIMRLLPEMLEVPEFIALNHYLGKLEDSRKLFQLSAQIAYLFDQYLIFRPELILGWDSGAEDHWQAALWRRLEGDRAQHPAALLRKLQQANHAGTLDLSGLPQRVSFFGISALPPFYLEMLQGISGQIAVNLFLLNPCREYWGVITSGREDEKILMRAGKTAADAGDFHLERGNRLLASWGKMGRDFFDSIPDDAIKQECFLGSPERSLLETIQADVLDLHDHGTEPAGKAVLSREDASLQIHSCHSPLRELEVLYDHLLSWFDTQPELAPRDVLVMTTDIEAYAPFIHAVFDCPESEKKRIPFSLADRSLCHSSHVIETFLALLRLSGSRMGAASVLALLENPDVRRKFSMTETDLETIRIWVEETRIRWGVHQQHRARFEVPGLPGNTWRSGIDRLLLGYALAGDGEQLFQDVLPYAGMEGTTATLAGQFAEFLDRVFLTAELLQSRHAPAEWEGILRRLLNDFFQFDDNSAQDAQPIYAAIEQFGRHCAAAAFTQHLELGVILEELNRSLDETEGATGFITGGVTFCAMKPMRSIPFKIICLLGMNDNAFPRAARQISFDLMSQAPKRCDRSSREDDRYLFLETLLSAREKLFISYVGQSIRDNSQAPPSVLVSELCDYASQRFQTDDGSAVIEHVFTQHRLQAFSPCYFQNTSLFSYSEENCLAGQSALNERTAARALAQPLADPEPEHEWRRVELRRLIQFFSNPSKYLLTQRIRLQLPEKITALEEREPFTLNSLDGYGLKEQLLERCLGGTDPTAWASLIQATGRLPLGNPGKSHYEKLTREVNEFHQRLAPFNPTDIADPVDVDLSLGKFQLIGRIERITSGGLLRYRCGKLRAKDILSGWIEHLAWQAAQPENANAKTHWVGTDDSITFRPASNAGEMLRQLLELYWTGLSAPLKFFPETSMAFVQAERNESGRSKRAPIDRARDKWAPETASWNNWQAESEDPFIELCFREEDPLDEEFMRIARLVFEPALAHVDKTAFPKE